MDSSEDDRPHGAASIIAMQALDQDQDALLLEALAFIGDLDFDVDATPDESDLLSFSQWQDAPAVDACTVDAPTTPMARNIDALDQVPVSSESCDDTQRVKTQASSPEQPRGSFTPPQKWPGASYATSLATNPSRNRRREEVIYLRGLVGDLEERLTSLRPNLTEVETVSDDEENKELANAWGRIAMRQHEQRRQSEMENRKLKRLLEDQIQLGKSLERILLRKRPTIESLDPSYVVSKRPRLPVSRSWQSGLVYEELLSRCANQYAETPKIRSKFPVTPPAPGEREIGLVHDPELGMTIRSKERRILPFSYEDTADELWGFLPTGSPAHTVHDYHNVDLSDDSLKIQVRVAIDVHRSHGEFSVKMAMRRYVEADRTVLVMSGLIEPSEISEVKMEGVRLRISAWTIVEPMDGRAATKLTSYHVSVPEVDDDLLDPSRKVGTLTDFLLSTMTFEIDFRSQQLENRLFQRAHNRRRENDDSDLT